MTKDILDGALCYLHARQYVHCDIWQRNILVRTDARGSPHALLCDFESCHKQGAPLTNTKMFIKSDFKTAEFAHDIECTTRVIYVCWERTVSSFDSIRTIVVDTSFSLDAVRREARRAQ